MGMRLGVGLAVLTLAVTGCASTAPQGARVTSSSKQSASGQTAYEDVGISTISAKRGTPTAVSRQAAVRRISTGEYAPLGRVVPDVELAWVRTNVWSGMVPTEARLAWVLTYRGVPEGPRSGPGPVAGTSPAPRPSTPVSCVFTAIVDARSGRDVSDFEDCGTTD
jgi:hypothetical protein